MKLRTFDGERVRGELTTDFSVGPEGLPVLLVNGEPFSPHEADFFLESATQKELEMPEESSCDLPEWGEKEEGYKEAEEIEADDHEN